MGKLFVVLLAVLTLQWAKCELKDQRHALAKINLILEDFAKAITNLDNFKSNPHDEKELRFTAQDLAKDIGLAADHLNKGVINNARSNEQGKHLRGVAHQGDELFEWAQVNLLGSSGELKTNIKIAIERYAKIIKAVLEVFPDLKVSTENYETGVEYVLQCVDVSLVSALRLINHIDFLKYTNSEFLTHNNELLEQDVALLGKVLPSAYNEYELLLYGKHLHYLVEHLLIRLNKEIESSTVPNAKVKDALLKTIAELKEISTGIKTQSDSKQSLDAIKNLTKQWLRNITTAIEKLDAQLKGQNDDIVTTSSFDIAAILIYYKTNLGFLIESKH